MRDRDKFCIWHLTTLHHSLRLRRIVWCLVSSSAIVHKNSNQNLYISPHSLNYSVRCFQHIKQDQVRPPVQCVHWLNLWLKVEYAVLQRLDGRHVFSKNSGWDRFHLFCLVTPLTWVPPDKVTMDDSNENVVPPPEMTLVQEWQALSCLSLISK